MAEWERVKQLQGRTREVRRKTRGQGEETEFEAFPADQEKLVVTLQSSCLPCLITHLVCTNRDVFQQIILFGLSSRTSWSRCQR